MKKAIQTMTMVLAGLALTVCVSLTSCKKGDTGPAGEKGTDGKNGSSNITTFTTTVSSSNWIYSSTDNEYQATIAVSSSVVNNGSIQLFIDNSSGSTQEWAAMPFSYGNVQMNYTYSAGTVEVAASLSTSGTPGNPGTTKFKVVVIPPGMVKTNVNIKNYADLQAAYNLKD